MKTLLNKYKEMNLQAKASLWFLFANVSFYDLIKKKEINCRNEQLKGNQEENQNDRMGKSSKWIFIRCQL